MKQVLTKLEIPGFVWESGKVRERALVDSRLGFLAFVTSDRISAFDVVLPTGIPEKGRVLNQLSNFWKRRFETVVPHDIVGWDHLSCIPYLGPPQKSEWVQALKGRTVLAKKAEVIPIECVVRGYIAGSLWKEYLASRGKNPAAHKVPVHNHKLPGDLKESEELPQPIFTPATKSLQGHDINLSYGEMVNHLREWLYHHPGINIITIAELLAQNLKSTSLAIYLIAREYARQCGIIIADTKFEFGFVNDQLYLIDEVLTPDSSRFWPDDSYQPGQAQLSFDKQYVRDWLDNVALWDHEPPAPELPAEVVKKTSQKYQEAFQRLTEGVLL